MLCYRCGRLGHRELHCSESMSNPKVAPCEPESQTPTVPPLDLAHVSTPWKTVQTRRIQARGRPAETNPRGKNIPGDHYSLNQPRGLATSSQAQWQRTHYTEAVMGQTSFCTT